MENDMKSFCAGLSELSKRYNIHMVITKNGISLERGSCTYAVAIDSCATAYPNHSLVSMRNYGGLNADDE